MIGGLYDPITVEKPIERVFDLAQRRPLRFCGRMMSRVRDERGVFLLRRLGHQSKSGGLFLPRAACSIQDQQYQIGDQHDCGHAHN